MEKDVKEIFKQVLKRTPLYTPLKSWVIHRRQLAILAEWEAKGKPVPPPHIVKQRVLRDYARRYDLKVLVETGTYKGEMVEALKGDFERIYSIELSRELHEKAVKRFSGSKHIEIIHGDSGIEIGKLLERLNQPTLFWLDGHYSSGVTARGNKDTPISEELQHIFSSEHKHDVVIIDDARLFGSDPGYPTIEELSDAVKAQVANVDIVVQADSIRITPR